MRRYSQREAAAAVCVAYGTLGRWLREGKVSEVARDRNGYRVFTQDDVDRIAAYKSSLKPAPRRAKPIKRAQDAPTGYKVASFFSGIGGFEVGFEDAGFEVAFQCEVEPFCRKILERHWPKVPRWDDIATLDHATIPISDVWVGGFPCQDLSLARM